MIIEDGCFAASDGNSCTLKGFTLYAPLHPKTAADGAALSITASAIVVQDCLIKASRSMAIRITGAAARRPVIKNCQVIGCLTIMKGSDPVVQDCEIRHGRGNGVNVIGGKGVLYHCDIHGHSKPGVGISDAGELRLEDCHIRDGASNGVHISKAAKGTFLNCRIHNNHKSGVYISQTAACSLFQVVNPPLQWLEWFVVLLPSDFGPFFMSCPQDCHIYGGKTNGLTVEASSYFVSCSIYDNQVAGMLVKQDGKPHAEGCQIYNHGVGIIVSEGGSGSLVGCSLRENAKDWDVHHQSTLARLPIQVP